MKFDAQKNKSLCSPIPPNSGSRANLLEQRTNCDQAQPPPSLRRIRSDRPIACGNDGMTRVGRLRRMAHSSQPLMEPTGARQRRTFYQARRSRACRPRRDSPPGRPDAHGRGFACISVIDVRAESDSVSIQGDRIVAAMDECADNANACGF